LKIGILIDELAPGSAPKVVGQACKGLEKLGHSCEALVLVPAKQGAQVLSTYASHLSGVKIKYVFAAKPWWDFKLPGFAFFSLHHILSFFASPLALKRKEYDIIIANAQSAVFAAWGMKLFKGLPYIFYIHCDPYTYTLKRTYFKTWLVILYPFLYVLALFMDKLACAGARAAIVSGRVHKERFAKLTKKPLEGLALACFPAQEFVPYSRREKAILAFDRWDIGNNPEIFLRLLQCLDSSIKLKLGGFWHPEKIKEDFLRLAKKMNLENRVELLGPLNEEMIRSLCLKTMLHVHANEEAFGMQTLEAAGCGCCIIIPAGSGSADLFQHGVEGYFPQKGNFNELLGYVKIIFSDLGKSEMMGRKAWEAARNYTWLNYAKNLDGIIRKYRGK